MNRRVTFRYEVGTINSVANGESSKGAAGPARPAAPITFIGLRFKWSVESV